ncbi:hypothetical protein KO361_00500, partial [Candidatus Woesearchaeota archaeon]|nr:hypothetical protein [Candidatus Woesearchaeota archaeon]
MKKLLIVLVLIMTLLIQTNALTPDQWYVKGPKALDLSGDEIEDSLVITFFQLKREEYDISRPTINVTFDEEVEIINFNLIRLDGLSTDNWWLNNKQVGPVEPENYSSLPNPDEIWSATEEQITRIQSNSNSYRPDHILSNGIYLFRVQGFNEPNLTIDVRTVFKINVSAMNFWVIDPSTTQIQKPDFAVSNTTTFNLTIETERQATGCAYVTNRPNNLGIAYSNALNNPNQIFINTTQHNTTFKIEITDGPGFAYENGFKQLYVICEESTEPPRYSYKNIRFSVITEPPTINITAFPETIIDATNPSSNIQIETNHFTTCTIDYNDAELQNNQKPTYSLKPTLEFTSESAYKTIHNDIIQFQSSPALIEFEFTINCTNLAGLSNTSTQNITIKYDDLRKFNFTSPIGTLNTKKINVSGLYIRRNANCEAIINDEQTKHALTFKGLQNNGYYKYEKEIQTTLEDGNHKVYVKCDYMQFHDEQSFIINTRPMSLWITNPITTEINKPFFAVSTQNEIEIEIETERNINECRYGLFLQGGSTATPTPSQLPGLYNFFTNTLEKESNKELKITSFDMNSGTNLLNIHGIQLYPLHIVCNVSDPLPGQSTYFYERLGFRKITTTPKIEITASPSKIWSSDFTSSTITLTTPGQQTTCEITPRSSQEAIHTIDEKFQGLTTSPSNYEETRTGTIQFTAVPSANINLEVECTNLAGLKNTTTFNIEIAHGDYLEIKKPEIEGSNKINIEALFSSQNAECEAWFNEAITTKRTLNKQSTNQQTGLTSYTLNNVDTGLPDGQHTITVKCDNAQENKEFSIDMTPPTNIGITLNNEYAKTCTNFEDENKFEVAFTSKDATGVTKYEYELVAEPNQPVTFPRLTGTINCEDNCDESSINEVITQINIPAQIITYFTQGSPNTDYNEVNAKIRVKATDKFNKVSTWQEKIITFTTNEHITCYSSLNIWVTTPTNTNVIKPDFAVSRTPQGNLALETQRPVEACIYDYSSLTQNIKQKYQEYVDAGNAIQPNQQGQIIIPDFNFATTTPLIRHHLNPELSLRKIEVICKETNEEYSFKRIYFNHLTTNPDITAQVNPEIVRNKAVPQSEVTITINNGPTQGAVCFLEFQGTQSHYPTHNLLSQTNFNAIQNYSTNIKDTLIFSTAIPIRNLDFTVNCTNLAGLSTKTQPLNIKTNLSDELFIEIRSPIRNNWYSNSLNVDILFSGFDKTCNAWFNSETTKQPLTRTGTIQGLQNYQRLITITNLEEGQNTLRVQCEGMETTETTTFYKDNQPPHNLQLELLNEKEYTCSHSLIQGEISAQDDGSGINRYEIELEYTGNNNAQSFEKVTETIYQDGTAIFQIPVPSKTLSYLASNVLSQVPAKLTLKAYDEVGLSATKTKNIQITTNAYAECLDSIKMWVEEPANHSIIRPDFAMSDKDIFNLTLRTEHPVEECKYDRDINPAISIENMYDNLRYTFKQETQDKYVIENLNFAEATTYYSQVIKHGITFRKIAVLCKQRVELTQGQYYYDYAYKEIYFNVIKEPPQIRTNAFPEVVVDHIFNPASELTINILNGNTQASACRIELDDLPEELGGGSNPEYSYNMYPMDFTHINNYSTQIKDIIKFASYPAPYNFTLNITCTNLIGRSSKTTQKIKVDYDDKLNFKLIMPPSKYLNTKTMDFTGIYVQPDENCYVNYTTTQPQTLLYTNEQNILGYYLYEKKELNTGLEDGTHTILGSCEGLTQEQSYQGQIRIDTVPPYNLTINTDSNTYTCSTERIQATLKAQDELSGISHYEYNITHVSTEPAFNPITRSTSTGTLNERITALQVLEGQKIRITAKAFDNAGNSITQTKELTISNNSLTACDVTPPIIRVNTTQKQDKTWDVLVNCFDAHSGCKPQYTYSVHTNISEQCKFDNTKPLGELFRITDSSKYCAKVCDNNNNCAQKTDLLETAQPQHCFNTIKDGDETDTDCGGSCLACEVNKKCIINSDCKSNYCLLGTCTVTSCTDGIRNGLEVGIDCGQASGCGKCPLESTCDHDVDCESGNCLNGTCNPPACDNNKKDGDETDIDCGGSICEPCKLGNKCLENKDCESNYCSNGTCRDPSTQDPTITRPTTKKETNTPGLIMLILGVVLGGVGGTLLYLETQKKTLQGQEQQTQTMKQAISLDVPKVSTLNNAKKTRELTPDEIRLRKQAWERALKLKSKKREDTLSAFDKEEQTNETKTETKKEETTEIKEEKEKEKIFTKEDKAKEAVDEYVDILTLKGKETDDFEKLKKTTQNTEKGTTKPTTQKITNKKNSTNPTTKK